MSLLKINYLTITIKKLMLIHSETLNPCKCGSSKKPNLDSDDMVPCWGVSCYDCKQFQHGKYWDEKGAVDEWNKQNPLPLKTE